MAKRVVKESNVSGVNKALLEQQSKSTQRKSTLPPSAQRRDRTVAIDFDAITRQADAGIESEHTAMEQVQSSLKEAADSSVTSITLTYEGTVYPLTLIEIAPDDIERRTVVSQHNERITKWLTPYAVRALTAKVDERGQIYPAIGQLLANEQIEIVDGARRRLACIEAHQPYKAYVSEIPFPASFALSLSEDTNEHKVPSLLERGYRWLSEYQSIKAERAKTGDKYSAREFAKARNLNKDVVAAGINGAQLPSFLFDHFPSPSDLGRPAIVAVVKLHASMSKAQLEQLEATLTDPELFAVHFAVDTDSHEPIAANAAFLRNLSAFVRDLVASDANALDDELEFTTGCKLKVKASGALSVSMRKADKASVALLIAELQKRFDID